MTERSTPSTARAPGSSRASIGLQLVSVRASSPQPLLLRQPDRPRRDAVRLAERHALGAHQPVGEIGGGGEADAGGRAHALGDHASCRQHRGHGGEAQLEGVGGVEHALFVLLHVLE